MFSFKACCIADPFAAPPLVRGLQPLRLSSGSQEQTMPRTHEAYLELATSWRPRGQVLAGREGRRLAGLPTVEAGADVELVPFLKAVGLVWGLALAACY